MSVRELTLGDAPALQRLMRSNAGYTNRVEGRDLEPDAAREVLSALPPDVGFDQKWDLGVWSDDALVSFVDVLVGWPQSSTAHIGLLMTDGECEGRGLGRKLHEDVVARLSAPGNVHTLRLSIVDTNATFAEPFWKKLGYRATGETAPYESGDVSSTARIWTRPLVFA